MTTPSSRDVLDHVVVLMFENRSFDNLLGRLYRPGRWSRSSTCLPGINCGASVAGCLANSSADGPQVELVIELNAHGRRRVVNPTTGSAAFAKIDAISWGLFGLAWGIIVGFTGAGGVLGPVESGLITGVLWGVFGVLAGAGVEVAVPITVAPVHPLRAAGAVVRAADRVGLRREQGLDRCAEQFAQQVRRRLRELFLEQAGRARYWN